MKPAQKGINFSFVIKGVLRRVKRIVNKRLGLLLICLILFIIAVVNLKPDLYLFGWDNYSSYFNLKTNMFRTFFSAWRDYRGFGTPSDSEIVDIFRQLIFLVLSPFLKIQIWDQIYFLICLSGGTLAMYGFIRKLLQDSKSMISNKILDLGSAVGALFYLFNLNTLSTFYFPIVTFNTRFIALPVVFWSFYLLITAKKVTKKTLMVIFLGLLFTSGSYITATVFITTFISLVIFSLFLTNAKRVLVAFVLFFGVNLFWLLPFANYTLQKAPLLKVAPTFVDANEAQLNKPKSFYNISKHIILYPNFFDTEYKAISTRNMHRLHFLAEKYNKFPENIGLYMFPVLYLLGTVVILMNFRKYRHLFFVPILIFIFLFLSLKEYSPLGFIYNLMDTYIPYFGILFRFGDTKFHAYIAFAGSVSVAVAIIYLFQIAKQIFASFDKKVIIGISTVFIIVQIFTFRSYFSGRLIGPFVYNQLPEAYTKIASTINIDKDYGRVLHLPYDSKAYWRSYTWGALGSSFFHYMLDKPYFDKTFEPASSENAMFDTQISDLIRNAQQIPTNQGLIKRAKDFYSVLKKSGISYIVLDGTINVQVPSRGVSYWGEYPYYDALKLVDSLENQGLIEKIQEEYIDIENYLEIYADSYQLTKELRAAFDNNSDSRLVLYKAIDFDQQVSFIESTVVSDPEDAKKLLEDRNSIASFEDSYQILPFRRRNGNITQIGDSIDMTHEFPSNLADTYSIQIPKDGQSAFVEVYFRNIDDEMIFSFYQVYAPSVAGFDFKTKIYEMNVSNSLLEDSIVDSHPLDSFLSDWHVLGDWKAGNMRLSVDGIVLPVPQAPSVEDRYIGSIITSSTNPKISLLAATGKNKLEAENFKLTDNPNCFGDRLPIYSHEFSNEKSIKLTSQNGSTCIISSLQDLLDKESQFYEATLTVSGSSEDLDWDELFGDVSEAMKAISAFPKPNVLNICLRMPVSDDCLNRHQTAIVGARSTIRVPIESPFSIDRDIIFLMAAKNISYQSQEIEIEDVKITQFKTVAEDVLDLAGNVRPEMEVDLTGIDNLEMTWKKPFSSTVFYNNPKHDFVTISNMPCEVDGYRTGRMVGDRLILGVENCYNQMFQMLPFDSSKFLLWSVDYGLLSGKYPQFVLTDKYAKYIDEYLSIYQGYPDIDGFKGLHPVEFKSGFEIRSQAEAPEVRNAYTFFYPQPELSDKRQKQFTLHQDSENIGLFTVSNFAVSELPDYWENLIYIPEGTEKAYQLPNKFDYKQILPSLWKVSVSADNTTLMKFNSGYDKQWKIYDNLSGVVWGTGSKYPHFKCDGYANCFQIPESDGDDYYIFYTPERLNFLGWIATIACLIFLFSLRKYLLLSS
ncbi:hypothetical protein ACFL1A_02080 [Patescibacteria group bacterium]